MRSIKKYGFSDEYFLTQTGQIYNSKTKKYRKADEKDHCFKLKDQSGKQKTISLRNLYKMVYGKTYSIDNISSLQGEEWRPIEGSQDYFISNYGRIISYKRFKAILLKQYMNKKQNGYLVVKITICNKMKNYKVHRLVAETFLQRPQGNLYDYQVHHIDGNRLNNDSLNLKWVTKEQHIKIHRQK